MLMLRIQIVVLKNPQTLAQEAGAERSRELAPVQAAHAHLPNPPGCAATGARGVQQLKQGKCSWNAECLCCQWEAGELTWSRLKHWNQMYLLEQWLSMFLWLGKPLNISSENEDLCMPWWSSLMIDWHVLVTFHGSGWGCSLIPRDAWMTC